VYSPTLPSPSGVQVVTMPSSAAPDRRPSHRSHEHLGGGTESVSGGIGLVFCRPVCGLPAQLRRKAELPEGFVVLLVGEADLTYERRPSASK